MTLSLLTSVSLFVSLFLLRSLLYHSACPGQGPPVMGPILPVLAAPSVSVCAAPILPVCAWARTLSACLCLGQDPSCLPMRGSGPILPVYARVRTHPACLCLGQDPSCLSLPGSRPNFAAVCKGYCPLLWQYPGLDPLDYCNEAVYK